MDNNYSKHKGNIVLGKEVMVSDPCYGLGTWCQGVVKNVLPGTYYCNIEYYDDKDWGTRVSAIEVIRGNYYCDDLDWVEENFEVGVDSGQAGIFDYEYYKKHHESAPTGKNLDENWYDTLCNLTYTGGRLTGNVIDNAGFVSSSGYGDGSYWCYKAEDINGNVIAIRLEFIDD